MSMNKIRPGNTEMGASEGRQGIWKPVRTSIPSFRALKASGQSGMNKGFRSCKSCMLTVRQDLDIIQNHT